VWCKRAANETCPIRLDPITVTPRGGGHGFAPDYGLGGAFGVGYTGGYGVAGALGTGGGGGLGGGTQNAPGSNAAAFPGPWIVKLPALKDCPATATGWAPNPLALKPEHPRVAFFSLSRPGSPAPNSFGQSTMFMVAYYEGSFYSNTTPSGTRIAGRVWCAVGVGIFNSR